VTEQAEGRQRLFLALWPDDEVRQQLQTVQHKLKRSGVRAREIRPQNLHMTVAFLGDVSGQQAQLLSEKMAAISASAPLIELQRLGHWRRSKVLFIAPQSTPPELEQLLATLRQPLAEAGFPDELDNFRPHITLFRGLGLAPNNWLDIQCIGWRASQLTLVCSQLTPRGAEYRILHRWQLD